MKKLDVVLSVILVAVFLPLSFWGGREEWAGATDSLAFVLMFLGAAYIIFEGVRVSSPLLNTLLGGLVPLLMVIPSVFVYRNADMEESIIMVIWGCAIGLVSSLVSMLVKKNKKQRLSQAASANQAGAQAAPSVSKATPTLAGINGWLMLPAIGMPLGLLVSVVNIIQSVIFLGSAESELLAGQYGGVLFLTAFEIIGKIGLFAYLFFLVRAFYKQKKSLPKRIITYIIMTVIFAAIRLMWGVIIFGLDDEAVIISLFRSTNIVGIIISAAIWIPYFKKSERVKLTFINS